MPIITALAANGLLANGLLVQVGQFIAGLF